MDNKIIKVLLAIVIIAAVAFGIYAVLPGQYKNKLVQLYQTTTDKNIGAVIDTYSNAKANGETTYTYNDVLTRVGSDVSWTVDVIDETNGKYRIHANAYKVTLNMIKEDGSGDNQVYTRAHVEIVMDVTYTASKATIQKQTLYINDEPQTDYYYKEAIKAMIRDIK